MKKLWWWSLALSLTGTGGLAGCGACAAPAVTPEECASDCSRAGCAGHQCAAGCLVDGQCSEDGRCLGTLLPTGTECRPSSGDCDPAETCDGKSAACPTDALAASGTRCRGLQGACDVAEVCDGVTSHCPADGFAASTTPCRPDIGPCDAAEYCSGAAPDCPADAFRDASVVCRPTTAVCDAAETCSGTSAQCPPDDVAGTDVVCRDAAGPCDLVENCDGVAAACPEDGYAGVDVECRAVAGDCDQAESCTGSGPDCPTDTYLGGIKVCRVKNGDCDVEDRCDGRGPDCPVDGFLNDLFVCREALSACDEPEHCSGGDRTCPADIAASSAIVCRPADSSGCDLAERCDGQQMLCPGDQRMAPPPATVLVDVADRTSVTAIAVALEWSAVSTSSGHAVEYQAQVDDNEDFSSLVFSTSWSNLTAASTGALLTDRNYFWRVLVRDVTMPTCLSAAAVDTFAIVAGQAPLPPTPVPAPDLGCASSCSVNLSWSAVASPDGDPVQYDVQVCSDPDCNNLLVEWGWATATDHAFTLEIGTYYWRVNARDATHQWAVSAWSGIDEIRVWSTVPPAPPTLFSAVYVTDCVNSGAVDVSWTTVHDTDGDPIEYYLELASNAAFTTPLLGYWTTATTLHFVGATQASYWWHVKVRDAVHPSVESAWSATAVIYDAASCVPSCPFIFVWDGGDYRFVTDIPGPVIGLPPQYPMARVVPFLGPLYNRLDGLVADAGGVLHLKLWETLKEVTYFDEATLVAVDHPPEYEIFESTAENTLTFGYAQPFKFFTVMQAVPPLVATDETGQDILAALLDGDGNPAPIVPGVDNVYVVDFGPVANPADARLLIDGWNTFTPLSATTVQPFVEVRDAAGQWVLVKRFGAPGGAAKTMVVEVPDLFVGPSTEIRIHLGVRARGQAVFDRIRLDDTPQVPISVSTFAPLAADLQHAGRVAFRPATLFNSVIAHDQPLPDDAQAYASGAFTRYGDVTLLLAAADDRFVIMRHGDAMGLDYFETPPAPTDLARTYFLKADIYYRNLSYFGTTTEPLPFHGMSRYPYDPLVEHYPDDPAHTQYRTEYNTRTYP